MAFFFLFFLQLLHINKLTFIGFNEIKQNYGTKCNLLHIWIITRAVNCEVSQSSSVMYLLKMSLGIKRIE